MGDSLTAGTVSADWVAALAGASSGWAAVNAGVNGQVRRVECVTYEIVFLRATDLQSEVLPGNTLRHCAANFILRSIGFFLPAGAQVQQRHAVTPNSASKELCCYQEFPLRCSSLQALVVALQQTCSA